MGSFSLEQPLTPLQGELPVDYLSGMVGMREMHAEGGAVDVTYDLLEMTAGQVEKYLVGIGLGLGEEWSELLRRGFFISWRRPRCSGSKNPCINFCVPSCQAVDASRKFAALHSERVRRIEKVSVLDLQWCKEGTHHE